MMERRITGLDRLNLWVKERPWVPVAGSTVVWLLAVLGLRGGGMASLGWAMAIGAFAVAAILGALAMANHVGRGETEAVRRQRARNIAIGLSLAGLVILFYVATLVRLGSHVINRPL